MPARRRMQEVRRKQRREKAAAEILRSAAEAEARDIAEHGYLADRFWTDYDPATWWCCPDCDRNHPLSLLADAADEIAAFLSSGNPR